MNKKDNKSKIRPVLLALGVTATLSLASIPVVNAASGNFGTSPLSSGYNLAEYHDTTTDNGDKKAKDGKCGTNKIKDNVTTNGSGHGIINGSDDGITNGTGDATTDGSGE